jgi:TPR repeat protein
MKLISAPLLGLILLAAALSPACAIISNDPSAAAPGVGSPPFNLKILYPDVPNFPADPAAAVAWIKTKAAANDAQAEYALGWVAYLGVDAPPDPIQATQFFEQAASQGHEEAMLSLGWLQYDTPIINGTPKLAPRPNPHGYELAAAKGNAIAAEVLAEQKNPMPGTPSSARMQWYRKLANLGVPSAQVLLGRYNLAGFGGLKENIPEAVQWFLRAVGQGDAAAYASLGLFFTQRDDGAKDLPTAVRFLKIAANRGAPLGLSAFGQLTANGIGVPKNEVEGLAMMYAAQAQGTVSDPAALDNLEKHLNPDQITAAHKRSEEILGPDKLAALQPAP